MKNRIFFLFLLSSICYSQNEKENYIFFSGAFGVKNMSLERFAFKRVYPFDGFLQVGVVSKNVEINMGFEYSPEVDYSKFMFGLGYHFPMYGNFWGKTIKTILIPSLEPSLINRWGSWGGGLGNNETSSHLSLGLNLAFRWSLSNVLSLEYSYNALPRVDIYAKYNKVENWNNKFRVDGVPIGGSNFFKLIYTLDRS